VEFARDGAVRRSGQFSAHVRIANGRGERGNACWVGVPIEINPKHQYLFRMYVRTIQVGFAYATFFEYAADGTFLSSRLCVHPKLVRGTYLVWQELDYLMGPDLWNPKTSHVRITLNVDSDIGRVSEAWFDDVSLVRLRRRSRSLVRRYGGPNTRISKTWYDDFSPISFDPRDEAAVRRYIDDSLPAAKAAEYRRRNILFYASFDGVNHRADADFAQGLREPLTASEVRFEKGRHGNAIHVTAPAGELVYRASRNFYPPRGTVAFWFKTKDPRNFGPFYVTAVESSYSRHLLSTSMRARGLARIQDAQGHKQGLADIDNSSWRPGEWIHFAFVWDQNFGVRVYVNGQLDRSTWGKQTWDECLHPSQIRLGAWHGSRCRTEVWLDELYIFGECLRDEEVVALCEGRSDRVGVRERSYSFDAAAVGKRLAAAGIRDDTPLVEIAATTAPADQRLLVRGIRVATAKQQTVTSRRAVDGIEGSYWPHPYFPGRTLDFYFEQPRGINYIELSGHLRHFQLLRKQANGSWDQVHPLVDSGAGPAWTSRYRVPAIQEPVIRYQSVGSRPGAVSEVRFAEVTATTAKAGIAGDRLLCFTKQAVPEDFGPLGRAPLDLWKRKYHRGVTHAQEPGPMSRSIVSLCPPEDRTMLVATAGEANSEARTVRLGPLQHAQLFSQTFPKPIAVDSVTLRFRVSRLAETDVLRLRMREPNNHFRNLVKMDFRVKNPAGPGQKVWLEMTLDVPDQVLQPGQRIWIDVAFASGVEILYGGADTSRLVLTCSDPGKSRREFVADQLKFVHHRYREDSEPHPWDNHGWEVTSRRYRFTNEAIYLAARAVLAVDPQNRLARAYWNRMMHLPFDTKVDSTGTEDAPEWARLQRELLRGALRIVHWWIDNRQMDDGQLGGHWADDVETAAMWPPLALIVGDEKVTRGLEKIADGVWSNTNEIDQEKGYTKRAMDVEHAHEPTTCSQPHMMLLRYGDPEYIERNLRTSRNIGEWTAINPQGRRLFRSHMFNAKGISERGYHAADVPYNALALRAATYVAWYNRSPQLLQWFREYGESWLEASLSTEDGKPRGTVPQEIVFKTGKIGGFSGHWSKSVYPGDPKCVYNQFLANHSLLGDRRYLDFLVKYDSSQSTLYRQMAGVVVGKGQRLPISKEYLDGLEADLQRLLGTEPLVTWAEPSTDRIGIPGLKKITMAYLGTTWSRACYPVLGASYEGGGADFAAMVLHNAATRLRLWLYSFRANEMKLGVRVWHLGSGTYRARLGSDTDGDGKIDELAWERTMPLAKFSRIDVHLPPRHLQVLHVKQVKPAEPVEARADLAIARRDVTYDAEADEVRVVVHNVGSKDADQVVVRLIGPSGRPVSETTIPLLRAPLDLRPKAVMAILRAPKTLTRGYSLTVDPDDLIPEITEHNNRVQLRSTSR